MAPILRTKNEAIELGLTIYLYCELEFHTLGRPRHKDSTKLPLSLDYSTLSPFPLLCEPF